MTDNSANHESVSSPQPAEDTRGDLMSASFLGLLATQFLGAANDNIFRWVVVLTAEDIVGKAALPLGLVMGRAAKAAVVAFRPGDVLYVTSRSSVAIGSKVFVANAISSLMGPNSRPLT